MKKYVILLLFAFLFSCNKDRPVNTNQFIPEFSFTTTINTNLPLYNSLQFPSNPILITDPGVGIKGIIVMKVGTGDYRAYEASCPNQAPSNCTLLTINGINAKCPCDNVEYSLFTGIGAGQFPLKAYKVEVLGANIRVYN